MVPTICVKVCLLQGYFLNEDKQPGEEADNCKTTGINSSPGAVTGLFAF